MSNDEYGQNGNYDEDEDFDLDDEGQKIKIAFDDGKELDCEVIGVFEVKDSSYIAILPDDEEEVLLFRYIQDEEGFALGDIESDEEYNEVSEIFLETFLDEE